MDESLQQCPLWVTDEQLINKLLTGFMDKLDRGVAPRIKINANNTPQLYDFNNEDTHYLWGLIEQQLGAELHILSIKTKPSKAGTEPYEEAQLYFSVDKEALVRHWLNRPKSIPYIDQWQAAIENSPTFSASNRAFLTQNPLRSPDLSAQELVAALAHAPTLLAKPLTLRSLSTKCFKGNSKFLDQKEDYIKTLFPGLAANIKPRALLVNAYLPSIFSAVLFVENQDTFLMLAHFCAGHASATSTTTTTTTTTTTEKTAFIANTALVYCAGFRGTATRIRGQGNTAFSYLGQPADATEQAFNDWWFDTTAASTASLPTYFWGDWDYSGFAILSALRKTFTSTQAWPAAYTAMMKYISDGYGHHFDQAGKENQKDPVVTGCPWTDSTLLPLLRATQRFFRPRSHRPIRFERSHILTQPAAYHQYHYQKWAKHFYHN